MSLTLAQIEVLKKLAELHNRPIGTVNWLNNQRTPAFTITLTGLSRRGLIVKAYDPRVGETIQISEAGKHALRRST